MLFQKHVVRTKFDFYVFCYCNWVDTSAGGSLVPEGIIRPVVDASALTFIIY